MFGFKGKKKEEPEQKKKPRQKKSRVGEGKRVVKPKVSENKNIESVKEVVVSKVDSYTSPGDAITNKEIDLFVAHALALAGREKFTIPHFIVSLPNNEDIRCIIMNSGEEPDDAFNDMEEPDMEGEIFRFHK